MRITHFPYSRHLHQILRSLIDMKFSFALRRVTKTVAVSSTVFITVLMISNEKIGSAHAAGPKLIAVKDHWHMAFGFNICGKWLAPLEPAGDDPVGVHTHGDGLVHAHPFAEQAAGKNGVMRAFFETEKISVSKDTINLRGKKYSTADNACDGKPAAVRTLIWPSVSAKTPEVWKGDPANIPFVDGEMIAFVLGLPNATVSPPASKNELVDPADLPPPPLSAGDLKLIPAPPTEIPVANGLTGKPPAKLTITDFLVGNGAEAKKGSRVYLRYTVTIWRTKAVIGTTSWKTGDSPEALYRLGSGRSIAGIDKGLLGMKVGGIRQIVIPPSEGFGSAGSDPILPTDTIVMVAQLAAVK
jgi:peptidylprolyl isomerase